MLSNDKTWIGNYLYWFSVGWYCLKKEGGLYNYMNYKMMHGRRRGSGWFAQILNLGLLITVLGIIINFLN